MTTLNGVNIRNRTSLRTTLLSIIPLFFAGPIAVVISYHPGWDPKQFPWAFPFYQGCLALLIFICLIIGVVKKFPRWSYIYAIYFVLLITFLVTQLAYQTAWNINRFGWVLYLVAAALLLLTFWLPAFRPFYANIRQDWTLLSYGLYACTLILLSSQDHDEVPSLNLLTLLPSMIGLAGAFLHLRAASTKKRIVILLGSMLLGIFITMYPVFDGMMSTFTGFLMVLGLMLTFWSILAALLLAPKLIGIFTHPRQVP